MPRPWGLSVSFDVNEKTPVTSLGIGSAVPMYLVTTLWKFLGATFSVCAGLRGETAACQFLAVVQEFPLSSVKTNYGS